MAKAANLVTFFPISLGMMDSKRQQEVLKEPKLKHFRFLLTCIFSDAKHQLTVAEEKIMLLKSLPAKDAWVAHNDKILDSQVVVWNNKKVPINSAMELISQQKTSAARKKLAEAVYKVLKSVAVFSEGEINAIYTDKKINDELRKFDTPYAETVREYRNDIAVVERLRSVVTDNFHIAHRFNKIRAKLLKQKHLNYSDRAASIGKLSTSYSFETSITLLKKVFGEVDPKYATILEAYVKNGQLDVFPRKGKTGGAFCAGYYGNPTFVLLNHVDSLNSYRTIAHEMGHAFHGELSEHQGPLYCEYSYALAETASTLFEDIAFDAVLETLPAKEKIIMLHDKINSAIATIPRQIACFNFELELHQVIRAKGFVPKEEIAALHNKHMQAYLGPTYKMIPDDGYMFVSWGHIRRFFYVYSYAYGLIVSQALLRRYRKDKSFWKNIERFLSAGGKDSPENILKEIGIDVTKPDFFREGLRAIEEDIDKLESLLY
jgi:oligoendopeptidase F